MLGKMQYVLHSSTEVIQWAVGITAQVCISGSSTCCIAENIFLLSFHKCKTTSQLIGNYLLQKTTAQTIVFLLPNYYVTQSFWISLIYQTIKILKLIHSNYTGPMVSTFVSLNLNFSAGKSSLFVVFSQHFKPWDTKGLFRTALDEIYPALLIEDFTEQNKKANMIMK